MNDDDPTTGLERLAPSAVATLNAFPALIPFLAMSGNAAALTAVGMSVLGSTIAYLVSTKVETALRAGLAKARADVAALRSDTEWAALAQDVRIDHLSRILSPEQTEQVGSIIEQMFRTHDKVQQKHLLALVQSVGAGPKTEDATRRKVIAEMTRIGPAHLKVLQEIAIRTKFSVRPGIGGSGKASRRVPPTEQAAKDLAKLVEHFDEPILDALEAAGFVKIDELVTQGGGAVPAYSSSDAVAAASRLKPPIVYVRCTSLGERALQMLRISVG